MLLWGSYVNISRTVLGISVAKIYLKFNIHRNYTNYYSLSLNFFLKFGSLLRFLSK